jgi:hypothetical protein
MDKKYTMKRFVDGQEIDLGLYNGGDSIWDTWEYALEDLHCAVAHSCMMQRHELADLSYEIDLHESHIKIPIARNQYYIIIPITV